MFFGVCFKVNMFMYVYFCFDIINLFFVNKIGFFCLNWNLLENNLLN